MRVTTTVPFGITAKQNLEPKLKASPKTVGNTVSLLSTRGSGAVDDFIHTFLTHRVLQTAEMGRVNKQILVFNVLLETNHPC
jgi:hypothetical protein